MYYDTKRASALVISFGISEKRETTKVVYYKKSIQTSLLSIQIDKYESMPTAYIWY